MNLTERPIAEHRPIRCQRLAQDFAAVRDKEQRQTLVGALKELLEIESGDDGLPRACRCDYEVAVAIVPLALEGKRFEHPLLMGVRPNVEVGELDRGGFPQRSSVVLAQSPLKLLTVDGWVVLLECSEAQWLSNVIRTRSTT